MTKSKSRLSSTPKICKTVKAGLQLGLMILCLLPLQARGQDLSIEIDRFSIQRIKIAIPDFRNLKRKNPDFSTDLPKIISNDLDLSGYFTPMDKESFLDGGEASTSGNIRFRNWSVIGADYLLTGEYEVVGRNLEVAVRLYNVVNGRQVIRKPFWGKIDNYRALMHRIGNEIIYALAGHKGIFLTKLSFVSTTSGHKEIYVSDYDGYNVKQLTFDESIALFPRWSPSGKRIAFYSYKGGDPMLYMATHKSGKVRALLDRKGLYSGASWTPDGKRLAFALSYEGDSDIYTVDLGGKDVDRVTSGVGINTSPTFSPDGKKMAFVSNRSGKPQIYVRELASGREERLTFKGNYNQTPSWSSLDRIAFSSYEEGLYNIYAMDSNGRNLRKLTDNQRDSEDPCWSPDGRYIVFSSNRRGGYHLYIMNANGQNQRRITFLGGEQTLPSWTP